MITVVLEQRSLLLPKGHGLFANCHASTLVALPGGDLLAAFFAGLREGEADCAIWLSRHEQGRWLRPQRLYAEPGLPHWNPVLHAEANRVWLFYKVGATVRDWTTWTSYSANGGRTWDGARPLVSGETAPRGPVKNKLIVLSDGHWLAPGSVETDEAWDAIVDRSSDKGLTWQRSDVPIVHLPPRPPSEGMWQGLTANALWETNLDHVFRWDGVIQPTLWESRPGRVHMLLRSTRGQIYRSDSEDGGRTWAVAYPTDLPNNNSGIDLARLADGSLVLAYNPVVGNWGRRTPISLARSEDNGATWAWLLDMESGEGEFSYPAVVTSEGHLHVTYTANRTTIVHHRFKTD